MVRDISGTTEDVHTVIQFRVYSKSQAYYQWTLRQFSSYSLTKFLIFTAHPHIY